MAKISPIFFRAKLKISLQGGRHNDTQELAGLSNYAPIGFILASEGRGSANVLKGNAGDLGSVESSTPSSCVNMVDFSVCRNLGEHKSSMAREPTITSETCVRFKSYV